MKDSQQNNNGMLPLACGCVGSTYLLPFMKSPPVRVYNYCAFVLGAYLGRHPGRIPFECFIQLRSPSTYSFSHILSFDPIYSIESAGHHGLGEVVSWPVNENCRNLESIADAIAQGYYVRFNGDEYFLKGTSSFRLKHFVHDNLIYGFCSSCRRFSLVGYRQIGCNLVFDSSTCTKNDLQNSLHSFPNGKADYLQDCMTLFRPSSLPITLDIPLIKLALRAYFEGQSIWSYSVPSRWIAAQALTKEVVPRLCTRFGIEIYDVLVQYLDAQHSRQLAHV